MEQLFYDDFANDTNHAITKVDQTTAFPDGEEIPIKAQVVIDQTSKTFVLAYYLRPSNRAFPAIKNIARSYQEVINKWHNFDGMGIVVTGQRPIKVDDAVFSRQVFIYYSGNLSIEDKAAIDVAFKHVGLAVTIRGEDYLRAESIYRAMKIAQQQQSQ